METNEIFCIDNGHTSSAIPAESNSRKDSLAKKGTADLETAITNTGCGIFNWLMVILIFPAACTGVCSNTTMSFVIPAAHELNLSPSDKAILMSAPFLGMAVSGYFWGFLSDIMGRKKLLATGFLLDFLLNIVCGTSMSVPIISIFKFLAGFIVCGPYSIFMVYISEVFSQRYRDSVAQFMGVFTSLGSITQAGLAMWLIPQEMPDWIHLKSWQVFILLCGLPSLVVGIACIFFDESPKFLVDKGKFDEALTVCKKIYAINSGKPSSSFPVKQLLGSDGNEECKKRLYIRVMEAFDLFRSPFLYKTAISLLYFMILFTCQNMLRMWTPEIFTLLQNSKRIWDLNICPLLIKHHNEALVAPKYSVYRKMMIMHATCMCLHFFYMLIVHRIGKKNILVGDAILGVLAIVSIPLLPAGIMLIISAVYLSLCEVACYAFLGAVVQLFPTHLRAQSLSLSLAIGRLGVVIGNFLLAKLIYNECESVFYGIGAGGICMVSLLCILNLTPYDDTKIKNNE